MALFYNKRIEECKKESKTARFLETFRKFWDEFKKRMYI